MALRHDRRQGDLLDGLPPALCLDASPERCTCSFCEPTLTALEREQHQEIEREWNAARKSWCNAHGVTTFELMLAERMRAERTRSAPSKAQEPPDGTRRAANTRTTTNHERNSHGTELG